MPGQGSWSSRRGEGESRGSGKRRWNSDGRGMKMTGTEGERNMTSSWLGRERTVRIREELTGWSRSLGCEGRRWNSSMNSSTARGNDILHSCHSPLLAVWYLLCLSVLLSYSVLIRSVVAHYSALFWCRILYALSMGGAPRYVHFLLLTIRRMHS